VVDRYPDEYVWFAPVFRVKVHNENQYPTMVISQGFSARG
jgi:hypothetical protein